MTKRSHNHSRLLRVCALSGLVALALMAWSLLDPRPIPVIVAMSIGQVLGTISLWGAIIIGVLELRHSRRLERASLDPPPEPPSEA